MSRKPPASPSLADRAREVGKLSPIRSTRRTAAFVVAIVCDSVKSPEGARRVLARHQVPHHVREQALALLDELTATPEGDQPA